MFVDEVPVEELYDEINADTRADLREFIKTDSDIHPNTQPNHGNSHHFAILGLLIQQSSVASIKNLKLPLSMRSLRLLLYPVNL